VEYRVMLKNITLSADDKVIKKARERAAKEHTTLNEKFRNWLKRYAMKEQAIKNYKDLMRNIRYVKTTRIYTREEMNER
jgi:hypothetical protein